MGSGVSLESNMGRNTLMIAEALSLPQEQQQQKAEARRQKQKAEADEDDDGSDDVLHSVTALIGSVVLRKRPKRAKIQTDKQGIKKLSNNAKQMLQEIQQSF
ncbi:hypothetical protein ACFX15_006217 [Malus domestica]